MTESKYDCYGRDYVLPDCIPTKRCYKCGEVKATTEFNKCRTRKDGLTDVCRDCQKAYHATRKAARSADGKAKQEIYRAKREEARQKALEAREPTGKFKVCTKCKLEKDTSQFRLRVRASGNAHPAPHCFQCESIVQKARHDKRVRADRTFKVLRVIETYKPELYNVEQIKDDAHIYCACTNLKDARIVAQQLRDMGIPHLIGVHYGNPDDGRDHTIVMRCITVFAEPVYEIDYDRAFKEHEEPRDELCIWDIWGKNTVL
jgi:hypothetical protein